MKRNYYIVALIMLVFFVISFLTNVIGPLIPDIIKVFNLSYTLAGVLPLAFFIAYGVMSVPSAMMLDTFKEKKIMVAAFIVAFLGSLLLAMVPNYMSAIVSLFLIGCGMAMLQVVINPLLRTSGGEENYAFTAVLAQLIFGLASFLSPLVYSYMVKALKEDKGNGGIISMLHSLVPANLPWISLYWLFAVICLGMVVILVLTKFPKVELKDDERSGSVQTYLSLFKQPVVIMFLLAMFCYVGTEQGIANWISQFLNTYHGLDPQTVGANTVAYFWGLMTAGGVVGLFLLKVIDSRKVLIAFTLLALVCLSAGLFGPTKVALAAFPLVGFFASVMYPIIFSLALNSVDKEHGSFAGLLVTAIIGGAIVPPVIGLLGDAFGLRAGMFFLYITLGYILSVGFWARPLISNKIIDIKKKVIND
ncbi:MAG: sugar MFS transporter [Mucilaginibacter sp.]|uniref:sugar MFS transporter n=1 Tax=Mucilaginibacter sp. TaxID=1882438 RepID=UPI0031A1833D